MRGRTPATMSSSSRDRPLRRLGTALLVLLTVAAWAVRSDAHDTARAAASRGHSYHLDCGAPRDGVGSRNDPWSTLSRVDEHGTFAPGDRILVRRGTTCQGLLLLTGSGTADAPIQLATYGRGPMPTIAGTGTGEATGAVELVDGDHWFIRGLHVTNSAAKGDTHRSGLLVINRTGGRLTDITLRDLRIDHVTSNPWVNGPNMPHQFGGISVITASDVPGAGFDRVAILNNLIDRVGRSGIVVWNRQAPASSTRDTHVRISGNRVTNSMGDGILLAGTDRGRIDHNSAGNSSNLPKCPVEVCPDTRSTASVGIWPIFSRNLRIDHNEAYGTSWGPGDGEGFDIDSGTENVVFEYNYAHDNEGGGLLLCGSKNVTVRFNIFEDNAKSALAFIGTVPAEQTRIYNNTFFTSKKVRARPVRYFNGPFRTHIEFRNNLVYNASLAYWVWPSQPSTIANTLIGRHRKGRPTDRLTSTRDPGLRAPGTGRIGFPPTGYKPKHPEAFLSGVAIPRDVRRDFFGKRIDPRRPPRGAAG